MNFAIVWLIIGALFIVLGIVRIITAEKAVAKSAENIKIYRFRCVLCFIIGLLFFVNAWSKLG